MIRKIFLFAMTCLFALRLLDAQVFNTAETLKPMKFSVGIAPIYYNENFGLLLMGEAGIKQDIDSA
jgi:hypothetical protein